MVDVTMKKIPQDNIEMVVDGLLTTYSLEYCLNAIKNHEDCEVLEVVERLDCTKQILPSLKNLHNSKDEDGYYHLECSDGELTKDSFQFLSVALINDNLMLFQKHFNNVIKELLGKAYNFKKGVVYKIDQVKDIFLIKHDHGIIKISHETGIYTITQWDKPFLIP